jgi:multidrug efflux pump subunit AcrA (membrane-fusion protein)
VAAGEELLRLDPIPFELAKARARASNDAAIASQAALKSRVLGSRRALHTASEQESIAQRELTRMRQLEEQGDASISLLDQARQAMIAATGVRESAEYGLAEAENSLRASTASVAESAAGLAIANDALGRSVVRAPFAGEVGSVTVALGTWLIPGTPTLRLVDRTSLEAKILLSAEDCTAIKPGQGVSLETALSGLLHGEVIGVDPEIRMPNRSRMVVVRVDNSDLVVPAGAHAAAIVDAGTKSGLWLRPSEYTVTDGDLRVWVLNSTVDAVSARLLKLGRPIFDASGQTWLPVLSGLEVGDKIAIDNLGALSDGVGVSALN